MTHKDKLRTGYSKEFEKGWNKIKQDTRVKCKECDSMISKFYYKKHNGLCINCRSKKNP